jgi:hypothetical protein
MILAALPLVKAPIMKIKMVSAAVLIIAVGFLPTLSTKYVPAKAHTRQNAFRIMFFFR